MGSGGFDRGVFVTSQDRYKNRSSKAVGGLLLLVVVGVLVVVGGYMFIGAVGLPDFRTARRPDSDLSEIAARLQTIEERLEQLEKRRSPAAPPPAAPKAESSSRNSSSPANSPASASANRAPVTVVTRVDDARLRELQSQYGTLTGDVAANREAWDAATDRLVGTTTELGEHRSAIADTRQRVDKMQKHFDRTPVAFEMKRGDEKERVGPVWLWLRKIDEKRHRYTLRVFVDDKWIELKDRALLEPVEFYLSGISIPLELVVTDIKEDGLVGTLAVPQGLYAR